MEFERDVTLDEAVDAWRRAATPAGLDDDALDELEDHVRIGARKLMEQSLAVEEAVWIAARRAGVPRILPGDFSRLDTKSVRRERLGWMVFGALALLLAESGTDVVAWGVLGSMRSGIAPGAYMSLLVGALAATAWTLHAMAKRQSALTFVRRYRWALSVGAAVLCVALAGVRLHSLIASEAGPGPESWAAYVTPAVYLVLTNALPLALALALLGLARRARNSAAPGPVG